MAAEEDTDNSALPVETKSDEQMASPASPTTPVDDETTTPPLSSDEAQPASAASTSTSSSPSKKVSRHKRKDSIGKIVIDANCKAVALQSQINKSQDPQPLETAVDIEEAAKPAESGATVITLSPCPYSGGNPELTGARFEPEPEEEYAIKFKSAYKHYGHGRGRTPVLLGLDMNVERGQIYGLLGPSGCGKTTLLKCIVGKLKLDHGSVVVFGEPPGPGSTSGVPGSRVGYMPQEMALFGEFNISETLIYFARVFGLTMEKYKERVEFLMKFLDLPSKTRALQNMSGGQQRRASLAVALLHEPELLILDEPTVGVDPLLRTSIWSHLLDLSAHGSNGVDGGSTSRTTIVITTHYIEEARQAHRVGMMRFGKLLAEGHPEDLLRRYQGPTLEDVFLELCLRDGDLETAKVREQRSSRTPIVKSKKTPNGELEFEENHNNNRKKKNRKSKSDVEAGNDQTTDPMMTKKENGMNGVKIVGGAAGDGKEVKKNTKKNRFHALPVTDMITKHRSRVKWGKVRACMLKTFTRMKKRWGFLIYQFALPALQVSLFCMAIGQDPKELNVAVVNYENNGEPCKEGYYTKECPVSLGSIGIPTPNEHLQNFTCRYLSFLDSAIATPVYYNNETDALKSVEDGHAWGVVKLDHKFTASLYERIFESVTNPDLRTIDTDLLDKSSINVRLDVTNQHIAFTLQLKLVEAFEQFMKQLIVSCDLPKQLASIPLVFDKPIYGSHELTFTDFMAPGIILTIVHSMALGYSAMIIIMERNEGMMDRTWVAGVTPGEFALAHFLVSLVVNLLQVVITLVFMILVFQVPAEGSIVWIFLLTMLQGIAGTTIGLIISAVCQTQQDATQIALGIFYPNLILSGIIWPIESMPVGLKYISYILPQTFACEAMRGILLRGWGLTYMPVWRGFVVTIAWIVATYAIFKKLVSRES